MTFGLFFSVGKYTTSRGVPKRGWVNLPQKFDDGLQLENHGSQLKHVGNFLTLNSFLAVFITLISKKKKK